MISVTFVTDVAIARMNMEHLQHAGATDVITFELSDGSDAVVGDIYIAPGVARRNARSNGVGVREEIVRLVVHGTLHVLGHSHAEDYMRERGAMWRTQEALVARLA
jgi:probable rRNA maturation factor